MTQKRSISRFTALVLGGLLSGLPAATALADEPTTAAEAREMAQQSRERADQYRAQGGVGYAGGRVQTAEAKAARYDALAAKLSAPETPPPVTPPEAEHYAELAAGYRSMGGVAYKTGMVQRAEAEQRKYEPAPATAAPAGSSEPNPNCAASKPVVRASLACNP